MQYEKIIIRKDNTKIRIIVKINETAKKISLLHMVRVRTKKGWNKPKTNIVSDNEILQARKEAKEFLKLKSKPHECDNSKMHKEKVLVS